MKLPVLLFVPLIAAPAGAGVIDPTAAWEAWSQVRVCVTGCQGDETYQSNVQGNTGLGATAFADYTFPLGTPMTGAAIGLGEASLDDFTLHASSQAVNGDTRTIAAFFDTLTFDFAPGVSSAMVDVGFSIEGTVSGTAFGVLGVDREVRYQMFFQPIDANESNPMFGSSIFLSSANHPDAIFPTSRVKLKRNGDFTDGVSQSILVSEDHAVYGLWMFLDLWAYAPNDTAVLLDFGNTSHFNISLPKGVSFTSAAAADAGGPVPEPVPLPGTLALAAGGLGGLGLIARRRRG